MTDWLARAKAQIADAANSGTDKTDERGVLSVLTVPPGAVSENSKGVSSVSTVLRRAVFDKRTLGADLIEAAMKVCDRHNDGLAAREEMRRQCLDLPADLRADLLDHFRGHHNTTFNTKEKLK